VPILVGTLSPLTALNVQSTETGMADNNNTRTGTFGLILGALVVVGLVVFIAGGGSKTTVEGDKDLPPVADPAKQTSPVR